MCGAALRALRLDGHLCRPFAACRGFDAAVAGEDLLSAYRRGWVVMPWASVSFWAWLCHSIRLFHLHSAVKIQPFHFSFWRNPQLRHLAGYSFGASREKASAVFWNPAFGFCRLWAGLGLSFHLLRLGPDFGIRGFSTPSRLSLNVCFCPPVGAAPWRGRRGSSK